MGEFSSHSKLLAIDRNCYPDGSGQAFEDMEQA